VFPRTRVAGLHVGLLRVRALLGRTPAAAPRMRQCVTITLLSAYVAVVEQRRPRIRAAMMRDCCVGGFFLPPIGMLNSAAVAALILLAARPRFEDSSFQLTFVAIGCIAGLAIAVLRRRWQPYVALLQGWRDVTRDAS